MAAARPPAVVFDLDGTVWDSAPGIVGAMEATLAELGLPHPGDDVLRRALGPPLLELLVEIGVPRDRLDEGRLTYRRHYQATGETACVPYPGIAELLDDLRAEGVLLATATSKGVEVAVRMLEHFDLARRFDVVEAASMTQAGHDKVQVIGAALAGLQGITPGPLDGAAPAVMVGDRSFDIDGGRHHGLRTIGVRWGYAPPGELEAAAPDAIVDTVAGLADQLSRHGE